MSAVSESHVCLDEEELVVAENAAKMLDLHGWLRLIADVRALRAELDAEKAKRIKTTAKVLEQRREIKRLGDLQAELASMRAERDAAKNLLRDARKYLPSKGSKSNGTQDDSLAINIDALLNGEGES